MKTNEALPEGYQWKSCPRCNASFACGHDSPLKDCGCRKIKLEKEHFAFLFANYKNCLCHDCLAEIAKQSEDDLAKLDVQITR